MTDNPSAYRLRTMALMNLAMSKDPGCDRKDHDSPSVWRSPSNGSQRHWLGQRVYVAFFRCHGHVKPEQPIEMDGAPWLARQSKRRQRRDRDDRQVASTWLLLFRRSDQLFDIARLDGSPAVTHQL
jgi:hypothetical protein